MRNWRITAFGGMYVLLLLILFFLAVHTSNNLVFLLFSFLLGLWIISAILNFFSLRAVSIVSVRMTNNFAQEKLRVDFQIGNQTENITAVTLLNRTSSFVCQPTEAGMFIEVPAQKRGKFHLGIFGFVSFYPFGLFRRTKYRENFRDASAVVYPEFEGAWPLSRHVMGRGNQSLSEKDNFEGLKEYAAGDSLADIAWKASARGQGVMTKQFEGTGILEEFILSLDIVPENDGEKKLSQLAVWAVQLNRQGRNFGLDLKGLTIASATGERHLVKILTALAFCGDRR